MSLTMISSNVAGYTKKQLTSAVVFIGFCAGNIAGPQTFITSEARKCTDYLLPPLPGFILLTYSLHLAKYRTAYRAMLIAYSIKLVMAFILYVHMYMFNKKRDTEQAASPVAENETIELGMHDVTEIDNKGFRYIL